MLDGMDESLTLAVDGWLADFEKAVSGGDGAAFQRLFLPDSHWRDLVAFTWHIATVSGAEAIRDTLRAEAARVGPRGFKTDPARTPPRRVTRVGRETVEAIFAFETAIGQGSGVVRLVRDGEDNDALKAWTLMTALEGIAGCEERIGAARPRGEAYARDFHGPNWLDQREADAAYADRDPAVLVVGGGQAGLSIAARLRQLGVDTLIVDREDRIGDNWRNRYHVLTLHNQLHVNHLPYLPFPPSWPTYIPKDMLALWFAAYAEAMELNFWTGTAFTGGGYDENTGAWTVTLRRADGTTREMRPRHVVMATGVSGIPSLPDIPSLADFAGTVIHSDAYGQGAEWAGKDVLIVGTGNSGHDIAQDLEAHGARAILIQRSPTTIVQVEPTAQLPYALYEEGPDLADSDLLAAGTPLAVMRAAHRMITERGKEIDKDLLDGLARRGFKIDFGADGTGWQFKYMTRGGGYYFNVGCSDLIVDGKVGLVQFDDIDSFVAEGARMKSGETLRADLVVLATGYKGQDAQVRQLFGDAVADRVGPIWGFDEGDGAQELRNMWTRTAQPGLWFIAGSFAQCRIYSKYMSLMIKACEEGMIPAKR